MEVQTEERGMGLRDKPWALRKCQRKLSTKMWLSKVIQCNFIYILLETEDHQLLCTNGGNCHYNDEKAICNLMRVFKEKSTYQKRMHKPYAKIINAKISRQYLLVSTNVLREPD